MNRHPSSAGATSSPIPPPARGGHAARGRRLAAAAVTVAALLTPFLPATGAAAAASADSDTGPGRIVAKARPGAHPDTLSAAQRKQLLKAATDRRTTTARALHLGAKEQLIPKDVIKDADGTVHTRYERTYAGLPVIGGDLVVHERAGGRTVTKASSAPVTVPTTKADLSAAEAKRAALSTAERERTADPSATEAPRLVVFMDATEPTLAWQSYVTGTQADGTPSRLDVVTDATTGKRLQSTEQINSGTGNSRYSGKVEIGTVDDNGVYELTDPDRGGHKTYDLTGGGNGTLVTDDDDIWGDGTTADRQTAAVDAAYGQRETWDFYKDRFGRNGIADNGVGASSRVHYGDGYANAYWDDLCFCMTYGDGLRNANPLTELDIAAHEMTHGVTYATAGLAYTGESGGLNEATSDIMGTAVEFFANSPADVPDYTIGELADVRGTGKPLRYMDQPSKDADAVKGTSADYWSPDLKKQDVHHSSGPANHFFYLLSEGSGKKTVNGVAYDSPTYDGLPVAGIGLNNATDIWYRALTTYMTSTTDYAAARTATLQAAADLFGQGSATYEAVGNAWAAVDVGSRFVHHIAVTAPSTRPVAVGQPTTRQIQAAGSAPGRLSYAAHGLPKGLSIDARTGLISGTPKKAGTFKAAVTVRNTAQRKARLTVRFDWPVLASGGRYFVNPARFDIPNWQTIESPLVVTGRKGNAPKDLKVTIDLVHQWVGGQVVTLVSQNGTEIPVKPWYWDTGEGQIHATYTVDASAVPADGTWKLRVTDATPGIYTVEPGHLDRWSLTF